MDVCCIERLEVATRTYVEHQIIQRPDRTLEVEGEKRRIS